MKTFVNLLLLIAIATQSNAVPTQLLEGGKGVDCFDLPLDIIFIIDGSNSVSPAHFKLVKNFIVKLVRLHDIGPTQTQIGVIQYGSTVIEEIALDEYSTNEEIAAAVQAIHHMRKGSMAGEALKYLVTKTLAGRSPMRGSGRTLLTKAIVITDGASQDYQRGTMTKYQQLAKDQGVEMYAIGVGVKDERGIAELNEIASDPDEEHVFKVDDYEAIEELNEIWDTSKVCVENECETGNNNCQQLCINTRESFYCDCREGYALDPNGYTCSDVDECETDLNTCNQICVNTPGSFHCKCNEGFHMGVDGFTCIDDNECAMDEDLCEQLCVNTPGSYYCSCMDGYMLAVDGFRCEDIDECAQGSVCPNDCVNTDGSFVCNCPEGFALADDKSTCIDIDECANGTVCPDGCVNTEGSFECNCPEGFKLSADKTTCIDIDQCGNELCSPTQMCLSTNGSYKCLSCAEGYELSDDKKACLDSSGYDYSGSPPPSDLDADDVNECTTELNTCMQSCVNLEGGFRCECKEGFELAEDGVTCNDVDECATDKNICPHKCVNTPGGHRCECDEGYELADDGFTCNSVDECATDKNRCSQKCVNIPGGHRCECEKGFKLAADGFSCRDINECLVDNGNCTQICVNTPGSCVCKCNAGFTLDDDKVSCSDNDECSSTKNNCGQLCMNIPGSFECFCKPGYQLDGDGCTCNDINECDDPNLNFCSSSCVNLVGSYGCTCEDGFVLASDGHNCLDVDECSSEERICAHFCRNTYGSYECACDVGYVLADDGVECDDIDECLTDNGGCSQICVNDDGSFHCECREGFTLMADNTSCEDVDECANNSPCSHQCVNTEGGVQCTCDEGYELKEDQVTCVDIDECGTEADHCSQICLNYDGFFQCQCNDGFVLGADGISCTGKRRMDGVSIITVTVIEETTTTITVTWERAKGAGLTMYVLTYCKVGEENTDQCSMMELDSSTNTTTLTNLESFTRYRISVVPWYGIVKGSEGYTHGTTKILVSNLTNLEIITNTTITNTTITIRKWIVTWELVHTGAEYEDVAHYIVTYQAEGGEIAELETNTTTVILVGLKEDTEYTITVVAVTVQTASKSDIIEKSFRTEAAEPTPIPPQNITTCCCTETLGNQAKMQQSIDDLIKTVDRLTQGIEQTNSVVQYIKRNQPPQLKPRCASQRSTRHVKKTT